MRGKILIILVLLGGLTVLALRLPGSAGGTLALSLASPTPPTSLPVCSGHGGPNCSKINPDLSVTCADGSTDSSYIILAVPQCQATVTKAVKEQFDFIGKSGCYPPSEMACVNEKSYQSLVRILSKKGSLTSELGKSELEQCRSQIGQYQEKLADYKQCLAEKNRPDFDATVTRLALPLTKAIFCPIFYGGYVSYDQDADMCVCDKGYFMSGGSCATEASICKSKYGESANAQNGNCSCAKGYKFDSKKTQCIKSK